MIKLTLFPQLLGDRFFLKVGEEGVNYFAWRLYPLLLTLRVWDLSVTYIEYRIIVYMYFLPVTESKTKTRYVLLKTIKKCLNQNQNIEACIILLTKTRTKLKLGHFENILETKIKTKQLTVFISTTAPQFQEFSWLSILVWNVKRGTALNFFLSLSFSCLNFV